MRDGRASPRIQGRVFDVSQVHLLFSCLYVWPPGQPFFLQVSLRTPILSLSHVNATTSQVKVAAPLVGSAQYFLPWATKITGARKSCSDWGPGAGPSLALPKRFSSQFHSLNLLFDLRG